MLFHSIDDQELKVIETTIRTLDGWKKGRTAETFRRLRINFTKEFGNSKVDHKYVMESVNGMSKTVMLPLGQLNLSIPANTCESIGVNIIRQVLSRKIDDQFVHLSASIVDQKDSELCVFLSVTSLFRHARPLAIIGAMKKQNSNSVQFHQMVLDHIDHAAGQYVIKNTQHDFQPVTKIPCSRALYVRLEFITDLYAQTSSTKLQGSNLSVVNENFNVKDLPKMAENYWYLLPHAYSLHFEYLDELALSHQRKIDAII
ncbi:Oidioi.mRNA.OKI2018_I69.XSR.g14612.t1.cds [Oikopleura dioica]|uniref:Oidioi.mRNA.OKI2018_I69.XSR.g14612.t1.cds n=1 Tax=Oikopleura dioica TaxID=34765 RepID=A0ABN7SJA2_OIKDI|nr:Oidioi.mRNA.OKI2018_I69.XSR.g14612.t1.cds [Oikopleura dioica]